MMKGGRRKTIDSRLKTEDGGQRKGEYRISNVEQGISNDEGRVETEDGGRMVSS